MTAVPAWMMTEDAASVGAAWDGRLVSDKGQAAFAGGVIGAPVIGVGTVTSAAIAAVLAGPVAGSSVALWFDDRQSSRPR